MGDAVMNECSVCVRLRHPFIISLHEFFELDNHMYLVYEFVDGVDLCTEIEARGKSGFIYSEAVIRHYFEQLLQAVQYCHEAGVIHRDVRPQCILLSSMDSTASLKLGGLGTAVEVSRDKKAREASTSPAFMAPEILTDQPYGRPADIWSCGVTLFLLLSGYLPFTGDTQSLLDQIAKLDEKLCVVGTVSLPAGDLLKSMLLIDPHQRITASEALSHPWIVVKPDSITHLSDSISMIAKYNKRRNLKMFHKINVTISLEGQSLAANGGLRLFDSRDTDSLMAISAYVRESPHLQRLLESYEYIIANLLNAMPRIESSSSDGKRFPKTRSLRLVQVEKADKEPLGMSLRMIDGSCIVTSVLHQGIIDRQGEIKVGDQIVEINNTMVTGISIGRLHVYLVFLKALFHYDPMFDDAIPLAQAGLSFKVGNILQVISKDDYNWWQARLLQTENSCFEMSDPESSAKSGLIPSSELQETRCLERVCTDGRETDLYHGSCGFFSRRRKYKERYVTRYRALFDQTDVHTYEEVVRVPFFARKTIILLGANGVGRRHIKRGLIDTYPSVYAYPLPHTSRAKQPDEQDGSEFYFATKDAMVADIAANQYLEYGTHGGHIYGTKLTTVRNLMRKQFIPVIDIEAQAAKILRNVEFCPLIVFIEPPSLESLRDIICENDDSLDQLLRETELLLSSFNYLVDLVVQNNDIDEVVSCLHMNIQSCKNIPQWVPASWVY